MHFNKKSICLLVVALGAACSKQDNQISESGNDDAQALGSATDITTNANSRALSERNTADNGLGGPVQRESGNFEKPLQNNSSDEELVKTVRVAITTGSTGTTGVIAENQLSKIQVSAQGGVITLSGFVENEEEKKILETQVAGMNGVKSVVNNLNVGPGQRSDTPLQPLYPRTPGNE